MMRPRTLILGLSFLLPGCGGADTEEVAQQPLAIPAARTPVFRTASGSGFVDDDSCRACHADVFREFAHLGMSHTFREARLDDMIEDLDKGYLYHEASDQHFEMFVRDERFWVSRYQLDEHGGRVNYHEEPVDYVVGSGHHVRSYIYRTESNEFFEMPIVWYETDKVFGMAPGFDRHDHPGFTRPVDRGCLFCHTAYPDMEPGADHYGGAYMYPEQMPPGIGCQRCHGPGGAHVEAAMSETASDESILASIVNPEKLEPHLRDDVCFQCHMQPTSRGASLLRRFDVGDFGYHAGEPLNTYMAMTDFESAEMQAERFEVNHQGYRMVQSPCWIGSAGDMTCMTCHDPHKRLPREDIVPFYRGKCLDCHESDHCDVTTMRVASRDEANCISCHMPERRPIDAPGSIVTDHKIDVHPLDVDYTAWPSPPGGMKGRAHPYRDDFATGDKMTPLYRLIAEMKSGIEIDLSEFEREIYIANPTEVDPWLYLADLAAENEQYGVAEETYARVLEQRPDMPYALLGLAGAAAAQGRLDEAEATYLKVIETQPNQPVAWERLGALRFARGDVEQAIERLEEAVRLRRTFTEAWFNLGEVYIAAGRLDDSTEAFDLAIDLAPDMASAYLRIGEVLRANGHEAEAIARWRHGAAAVAHNADIPAMLALHYVVTPTVEHMDYAEADRYARLAVDRDPRHGGAQLARALAASVTRQFSTAVVASKQAEELGADPATCRGIRAIALHHSGKRGEARSLWREVEALAQQTQPDMIRAFVMQFGGNVF